MTNQLFYDHDYPIIMSSKTKALGSTIPTLSKCHIPTHSDAQECNSTSYRRENTGIQLEGYAALVCLSRWDWRLV
jgi:hypothetical protein